MDIPRHRKWIYNRLNSSKKGHMNEFLLGVEQCDTFTCHQEIFTREDVIRCTCLKCKNRKYLNFDEVKIHLYLKGFKLGYWSWSSQGKEMPIQYGYHNIRSSTNADDLE